MNTTQKFINRLKIAADKVGSQAMLAEKAGLSPSVISKYMNGGSEPDRQRLIAIASAADVDIGWLASGHGDEGVNDPEIHMIPFYTNTIALKTSEADTSVKDRLELRETPYPVSSYFLFKLLGAERTDDLGAFIVHGDCMEPTLKSGEVVIVDLTSITLTDGIHLIADKGVTRYRRIHLPFRGGVELQYDNSEMYRSEHIEDEDLPNLEIVGRLIWHGRRI